MMLHYWVVIDTGGLDELCAMPVEYFRSPYCFWLSSGSVLRRAISHGLTDTDIKAALKQDDPISLLIAAAIMQCVNLTRKNHFPYSQNDDGGFAYTARSEAYDDCPPGLEQVAEHGGDFGAVITEMKIQNGSQNTKSS